MRPIRHPDGWLAAGLLVLFLLPVHYPVIFEGYSLVHTNYTNPLDFRSLPQNYGEGLVPQDEWTKRNMWPIANIRDPGAVWWQWEPSTEFLKQAIRQREWPFWDPYIAAGTPAMANMIPAFFFPPYTLMVALGASVHLKNAYFLFLLWSTGFFTFLFLRRHGLSFLASLVGGAIVLMGGAMNQNTGSFAEQTAACLPFGLYATRVFLDSPGRQRTIALTLAYATVLLASFPPPLVGVLGVIVLYAAVAIASGDCAHGRYRTAVHWLCAALLSMGLVGFYYGPVLALRHATPHVAAMYRGAGLETMPIVNLFQFLSPTVMGGVQVYWKGPFASPGFAPHIPYVGIATVTAVLLARPFPGRSARTLFVTTLLGAAAIMLKLFGIPPMQWMGYLPFLNQIHFAHHLGVPLGFIMAFLAAQGVEAVIHGRISRTRMLITAGVSLVIVESLWRIAARTSEFNLDEANYWVQDWKFVGVIAAASAITLSVAALCATVPRERMAAVGSLLALICAEGVYNNGTYPRPKAWDMFEYPVPYVRVLQKEATLARVLAFGTPPANTNEAFGVFVLDSLMAFNPPRIYKLYRRYTASPPEVFMRQARYIPPESVLDRANIAFIGMYSALAEQMREAAARGYSRRFDDGFVTLFGRGTQPRFLYSSEYRVTSKAAALEEIATAPSRLILLEESPGFAAAPNTADDPEVRVEAYGLNSVIVSVDAPRPGLVYASESYFDGWRASVSGAEARILPANYAFRAVAVPAGRCRIEFHYRPPGLTAGLATSALSLALLIGWILIPTLWPAARRMKELTN